MEPTVFVVDDDESTRVLIEAVMKPLNLKVEGYSSPISFLDMYDTKRSGCLVCDVMMPDMSGLELLVELGSRGPSLPVIFTTAFADIQMVVRAMKLNAEDVLEKPVKPQILIQSVQKGIRKDARVRFERTHVEQIRALLARLTTREREVLDLLVSGMSNRQMGQRLGIREKTIESHRGQVMKKLMADSLAEVVRMVLAVETRIVTR